MDTTERDPLYAEAWALVDEMQRAVGLLRARPVPDLDEEVAVLLERTIAEATRHIPAWTAPSAGLDVPAARSHGEPARLLDTVWEHFGVEIALARKVLTRAPQPAA